MSKSSDRYTSLLFVVTLFLAVNMLVPGCAHTSPSYASNNHVFRVDKNGPPFTKYPHLGRNHFNRTDSKSSGGR